MHNINENDVKARQPEHDRISQETRDYLKSGNKIFVAGKHKAKKIDFNGKTKEATELGKKKRTRKSG